MKNGILASRLLVSVLATIKSLASAKAHKINIFKASYGGGRSTIDAFFILKAIHYDK